MNRYQESRLIMIYGVTIHNQLYTGIDNGIGEN